MNDARLFLSREEKMDSVEMENSVFPVVRKRDVGEKNLTVYAMHKTNGTICIIVPFIELEYKKNVQTYKGNCFIIDDSPEIIVHKNELASICCINTELTNIFCHSPLVGDFMAANV